MSDRVLEPTVRTGMLQVERPGTRWLSTGWDGGTEHAATAYNVSVPKGWPEVDLDAYVADRRSRGGFDRAGPTLLTGVGLEHLRGARCGPVEVYATAGVSNPGTLPVPATDGGVRPESCGRFGTVNLLVGTRRALADGALANLVAVVAEAKATTLLAEAGVPGTTTDAIIVGSDPDGERAVFTGSATQVGEATRACVREALLASLRSRYPERAYPDTVAAADYGCATERQAEVFQL